MENKVKTRRRKDRKASKLYHFRFETELKDKFVKVAEEAGYNTTEALEVLMQKAIEGLLPKKVVIKEMLDTKIQNIFENEVIPSSVSFRMNTTTRDQFIAELLNNNSYVSKETQPGGGPQKLTNKKESVIYNGFQVEIDNSLADEMVWTMISGSIHIGKDIGETK